MKDKKKIFDAVTPIKDLAQKILEFPIPKQVQGRAGSIENGDLANHAPIHSHWLYFFSKITGFAPSENCSHGCKGHMHFIFFSLYLRVGGEGGFSHPGKHILL